MAKSNVSAPIAPQDTAHPEPAAVWVDIKSLKPWDRNPRKNQAAVAPVAASMKRFGFGAPILARRADGEIIAGHTRILAAESLGLTRVPVRYLDLDPADAHLLALADNKLNEKAEWDDAEVGRILSEYGLEDAALAGWDSAELDKMAADLAGGGKGGGANDPDAEWAGMPEFVQEDKTAFRSILVHLDSPETVRAFLALIGQPDLSEKAKFTWYPERQRANLESMRYESDAPVSALHSQQGPV